MVGDISDSDLSRSNNVRDAALAQLSHQRICVPATERARCVVLNRVRRQYGEVVALRTGA